MSINVDIEDSWNPQIRKLLKNWSKQITINEQQHLLKADKNKKLNIIFVFFDIIGKACIFTTLLSSLSEKYLGYDLLIFVTIVEALTIATEGLAAYFDFSVISQKHFEGAREYNSLSKLIDSTLSLKKSDRGPAKEFITFVIEKFKFIAENTIDLPYNKMVHQLELQIYKDPSDACGNSSKDNTPENSQGASNTEDIKSSNPSNIRLDIKLQKQKLKREDSQNYQNYQWNRFETELDSFV